MKQLDPPRRHYQIAGHSMGITILATLLLSSPLRLLAEEPECGGQILCAGTVIDTSNIDQLLDATFDGHQISDLLLDSVVMQVRDYNLKIELAHAEPWPRNPYLDAASEANIGKVTLDPATRRVVGWEVGEPFPNIDEQDPDAGLKIMWNFQYALHKGNSQNWLEYAFMMVDRKAGLHRTETYTYQVVYAKGRYGPGVAPIIGDGTIAERNITRWLGPKDKQGDGAYAIHYDTGAFNDTWAYAAKVRRTRRVSGASWFAPIGSLDYLTDDGNIFRADPTWYPQIKLLGKKTILAVGRSKEPIWVPEARELTDRYPRLDLANPPHWNPVDDWEPREVYVVEITPPEEHPYSRKVLYLDTEFWMGYMADAYDREGDLYKWFSHAYRLHPLDYPGGFAIWGDWATGVNFKRDHASIFGGHSTYFNGPEIEGMVDPSNLGQKERAVVIPDMRP
ncbi:MAG: DUF1329 domain-containing protein [Gammaproteobacteria bacterium]|nr:DUF1329 domain-containing protein [Gammaproteobacteria bacterium]